MSLKEQFEAETGKYRTIELENGGLAFSDEYVGWLEAKVTCLQPEGKVFQDTGYGWHCIKCEQKDIPGTHVTYDELHVNCGGHCK